ncbi:hypothetical protein N7492_004456 [Penicillium capsulatum]|uniref:40S ribosomal protein S30 n=1 Tax=Penicillium capsulatum TaxID=69766 RepID=A0A9W9LR63_9EURO|nr:hypothetical protein N7492_004456 [Penicillium capsulatum]
MDITGLTLIRPDRRSLSRPTVALPILQPYRALNDSLHPSSPTRSPIPSIAKNHPTWVRFTALSPVRVEPQEKKKNPKGRAYKRVQYTRRFVNVTMTGGKRKMNPNPGS